jgi:hypothetical protein
MEYISMQEDDIIIQETTTEILHQPTVSDAVCSTCRFNKSNTYHDKMWCRDCQQKNHYEQTEQ